ncbi:MAG: inorganic phosphate transporter [Elainella sp. Prado103]|nr:inorganic phosphate transporter [Elainella sp. Prado103]
MTLPIDWPISSSIDLGQMAWLGLALLLALTFEFVNGFHDTANAVATVIYTQSLKPIGAVVWSGLWNLIGVLTSTGTVAFSIMALLPNELILTVGSGTGWAMVFALLLSAILWNLGTWYLGLPASSSHTLIGAILGVGFSYAGLTAGLGFAEGINWSKTQEVLIALLTSPLIGFGLATLLFWLTKRLLSQPGLYEPPPPDESPPLWIRVLLILTCTGVSFAHGSNDGQKGMGLIVLILVGILPGLYAINPQVTPDTIAQLQSQTAVFIPVFERVIPPIYSEIIHLEDNSKIIDFIDETYQRKFPYENTLNTNYHQSSDHQSSDHQSSDHQSSDHQFSDHQSSDHLPESTSKIVGASVIAIEVTPEAGINTAIKSDSTWAQIELTRFLKAHQSLTPTTFAAIAVLQQDLIDQLSVIPRSPAQQQTLRTQLYLISGSLNKLIQIHELPAPLDLPMVQTYRQTIDHLTQFIPVWVKVAVALALGCGTLIGWQRIVTTVGEKIGKTHLTYAQGGVAELVAMGTIVLADRYGLPVSTTHVLASGVTGTMVANQSGVQLNTIRQIALAWILTLPCCMALGGLLFALFSWLMVGRGG